MSGEESNEKEDEKREDARRRQECFIKLTILGKLVIPFN